MSGQPHLTLNLVSDVHQLLAYRFMVNALQAAGVVAVMAAVVGWFMVLRRETFAGHTLSVMSFPGAAAAALAGVPLAAGYFLFCAAGALILAGAGRGSGGRGGQSQRSALIGTVQAVAWAVGFLLLSLYGGVLESLETLLFGSILGVTRGQVLTLGIVAICTLAILACVGRPLFFASVDGSLARASRVPVRALAAAFLLVLGLAVAATVQITGVLLVFALLLAPAAIARELTPRIGLSLALSVLVGLAIAWVGLGLSYFTNDPPGFFVSTLALVLFALARAARGVAGARRTRRGRGGRRCRRWRLEGGVGRLMLFAGFLGNALLAGSCIAIASGLIGWFVVLRGQVFAGDALSHVAFTGALAAAAAGLDLRIGLFLATVLAALLLAALGARALAQDVTIGLVFVWALGLGVLFLSLFNSGAGSANGTIAARTLFGSIFALSAGQAQLAAVIAAMLAVATIALGRPLLFASIDAPLARARGVPVRGLGFLFLALLGVYAAEATQAVGALLLLGLLAAPAGAAHRLTANPYRGMAVAVAIALLCTWIGLALGYWIAVLPPGSAVILVAAGFYALTMVL